MTHLIDKDVIVAEIERRTDELYDLLPDASKVENGMITISEACNTGKYTALESFKDYIDTLEVKPIDLEKDLLENIDVIDGITIEREEVIEKACEWLKDNASNYIIEHPFSSDVDFEEDKMIDDFKKYMKGE